MRFVRPFLVALVTLLAAAGEARAQASEEAPLIVDTIIIVRHNVFTSEEAQANFAFRLMNSLHITTHDYVIRREMLLRRGEPFDSALVSESERNLRNLQIFRELSIDTTHVDGRFAVVVTTIDGWSTKPKFEIAVASDGTTTFTVGITEVNLLGTANFVHLSYRQDVDRNSVTLVGAFPRVFGPKLAAGGALYSLSDGTEGNWRFGMPYRSALDRRSLTYDGEALDRRILQFRTMNQALDTTLYQRQAFINRLTGSLATLAEPGRYMRFGVNGEIRREEMILGGDSVGSVPDTVYGQLGAFVERKHAKFMEVRRFNGFGTEDLDLSLSVKLYANLAPDAWGYERTGVGPGISAQGMIPSGRGFIWGSLDANALFNGSGVDSGRVVANVAFGIKPATRHATAVQVQVGWLDNPRPGEEFDLGFGNPPRNWEAHSFVGTRTVWGTFEHRWFVWDALFNLVGVGFAGFVDYGGAWYPDQERRFGGNVGIGLRLGSALSTIARTGRLDLGYKFGDGVTGSRWTLSFGSGFVFPIRRPMVASDPTNQSL